MCIIWGLLSRPGLILTALAPLGKAGGRRRGRTHAGDVSGGIYGLTSRPVFVFLHFFAAIHMPL